MARFTRGIRTSVSDLLFGECTRFGSGRARLQVLGAGGI